ncbi:uncharacterized protein THITE_2116458 [Thermothielavioides terrestris NRRL 8126]|uniref:FAD-binding domain-containing protein n=1 Tax=Thermothielavioides terrestris (strain ATCC 38088 / NRRL 8126) TaxID=578455 RepID=G2R624_THETT|nr:uncharacterized protein THITE_2116458 [Thermothielavioides terrestris NRRL 8126]AEO67561.1 hypothetical protein THITE_2116458 [Thermothielavioides terrestris NRRL 8126]
MSNDPKLRVLVVGASIAGPAAAYWLAKAGARVTVIERFPQLRTNGQNVDIRGVGVTVMRKMPGMEAAVRAKRPPIHGLSFVDARGRAFATIKPTGNPDQQSLVSEYEILRGDLSQILFDLTKANDNITYVFGEQIASIEQPAPDTTSGPVTVTFANGRLPPSPFDLIVACDGSTSRTRALAFGCSAREHMHPTNWWAAYFSLPTALLPADAVAGSDPNLARAYNAPGGRLVCIGPDADPRTTRATIIGVRPRSRNLPAEILAFRAAAAQDHSSSTSSSPDPSSPPDSAIKSFITHHLTHPTRTPTWPRGVITALLAALPASPDFHATELSQVRPPRLWTSSSSHHAARVALVGDAGYASGASGAGASLALAGAYVLAGEICRALRLRRLHPRQQRRAARDSSGLGLGKVADGESGVEEGVLGWDGTGALLDAALERYEAVMMPLVAEMRRTPGFVGAVLAPQSAWGLWLRNWALWAVCRTGVSEAVQRFAAGAFAKREEAALPEYEWVE